KEFRDRFRNGVDTLRKLRCIAAMDGAGLSRHFISGQNDFISGTRHLAPGRGERVGSRANGYARHRHGRLERFGWVTRGRFIHHLHPYRQGQGRAVATRNDRSWLIEPNPDPTSQRAGIAEEPRVLIIVSRSGFAGGWKLEPK